MDEDLVLALRLQEEWNLQASERERAQAPLSLVDASWELVDPTPDLQALFVQFNDRFFWGQLEAVEVKWSMRMTLCAGICSYEGRGGMCSIRLSEPLLKLRPRKDLVETLLHEMIHAYLFVTNNDKDREGHGPEFCKHMHRINRLTGANITVYHTFHDEVDEYRRHWWRCDGPCRHRKPYYGYVKRATNRAPSAHDYWWAEHQQTCGGTYVKIKEPENYARKGKGKARPGRQPAAAGRKDQPTRGETQPLIPFSGKGYVLGDTSNSPSPGRFVASHAVSKTQDLFSQDQSAKALRPNSKAEVKSEQNGPSRKTSLVSPVLTAGHQNVVSNYFPRVSAVNQKAFRSVSGSPAKSGTVSDLLQTPIPSGSHRRVTSSKISLRNSLKAPESTSVTAPPDGSGPEERSPSKRARLEDRSVLDHFFKKEKVQSGANDPAWSSRCPAAAQSSSSLAVSCPVCQKEVLESQINEHLDRCLEVLREESCEVFGYTEYFCSNNENSVPELVFISQCQYDLEYKAYSLFQGTQRVPDPGVQPREPPQGAAGWLPPRSRQRASQFLQEASSRAQRPEPIPTTSEADAVFISVTTGPVSLVLNFI